MIYKTHSTMAFAVSFLPVFLPENINFITSLDFSLFPYIGVTILLISLFPDLDERNSYLSRKFPWNLLSIGITSFTNHRGLTHRFLAVFIPPTLITLIELYTNTIEWLWPLIYFSFISYLSHLIGDGFTIGGLKRFFYPFSKKTVWFLPKSLRFKTGSFTENIWLLFFTLIVFLEVFIYLKKTGIFQT